MIDWLPLHFLRPAWLLLLPPLLLLGWWLRRNSARASWQRLIAPQLLPHLLVSGGRNSGGNVMLLCILLLATLAAAGPSWDREAPPFAERQAPLLIALNLSSDMDQQERGVSRLERAKLKIHDLLAQRPGARHALLAYAGSAHLLLPPTDDATLFTLYLDSLSTELMPRLGRDTPALLQVMDQLQAESSQPYMRLLISADVEEGAEAALANSHSLLWVAGGDSDALSSRLDSPVVAMRNDDSDLPALLRALDASQRLARQDDPDSRWHDRGWWLLWPAALLLALRLRRAAPALLLLPLLQPGHSEAAELELWRLWRSEPQQAMQLYRQGAYAEAATLFSDPRWRGAALYRASNCEAALAAFEQGTDAEDYYNQGNALSCLQRHSEAAERYQLALALRPHWQQAQENLQRALLLVARRQQQHAKDADMDADDVRNDLERKRGVSVTEQQSREQQTELWLDNLQGSPAGYLKRRMLMQLTPQEGQP
ncbi:VWA domain-containing protein [Halopseudomonas maritima]|uniref:VWA domain-containing protein n=1 Tax=Halopseudomonas maritima TaxID=2918528 RepID=UPI001EEBB98D|nr:VWA domain-containing protein [Halopseudomonas maritima]UJJ33082.1 VWA domain-containing protein [Halopseudomonas maritima]